MDNNDFIKATALKLSLPEELVANIIHHSWKRAKEATLWASTIELTGIGRLMVRMNIVEEEKRKYTLFYNSVNTRLQSLDKEDDQWYPTYKILKTVENNIEFLNKKKADPTLTAFRADKPNRKQRAIEKKDNG